MRLPMFKRVDRLVAMAVLMSVGMTWVTIVSLDAFRTFLVELNDVGQGTYTLTKAASYVLLTVPRRFYEMFGYAALIGGLMGLGGLANSGELTALRAAGLSKLRICASVALGLGLLTVLTAVVGETVGPFGERKAQSLSLSAKSKDVSLARGGALWARDGDTVISARRGHTRGSEVDLDGVRVFDFDADGRLRSFSLAEGAAHSNGEWTLRNVRRTDFTDAGATSRTEPQAHWQSGLDPRLLAAGIVQPQYMPLRDLERNIYYLQRNNQDASAFLGAFWARLFYPVNVLTLAFCAVPFAFGALRSGGLSKRLFLGIVLALGFYFLQRAIVSLGAVYNLHPATANMIPPLLLVAAAFAYFRRNARGGRRAAGADGRSGARPVRSPNIRYMPAVDHLRAFAALLIVFYHGLHLFSYYARFHQDFGIDHWLQPGNPLAAALAEGHTAVALFMVLSGFILTQGALDAEVDYGRFIRNRLLRTYPLFLLLVFTGAAAAPDRFQWAALLQTVSGFANLPGALVAPPFTSMLWTIGIEWQFYVLFPWLVATLKPDWTRRLLGFLAVLLLFRAMAVAAGGNARDIGYLTLLGRLDQFLAGMWAAWWFRHRPLSRRAGAGVAAVALVVAIVALALFNAAGGWPAAPAWKIVWPTFEAVLWAAFVLGYVAAADASRGLPARVLAGIGEISYSIYLVHFLIVYPMAQHGWVFAFTGHLVVDAVLDTLLLALPATLLLAALTYRCVELPFLRLRGVYHREVADRAPS